MSTAVIGHAVIGSAMIDSAPMNANSAPMNVTRVRSVRSANVRGSRQSGPVQQSRSVRQSRSAQGPSPVARLHLTRRGRVVLTVLAAVPLVLGALFFAIGDGGAAASSESGTASFSHVTVDSGQSLWQIAETIAPSADPRDVVAAIIDLNQLQSALVMPGQQLAIPAQYAH